MIVGCSLLLELLMGYAHLGHVAALFETSTPHSGQLISAISIRFNTPMAKCKENGDSGLVYLPCSLLADEN